MAAVLHFGYDVVDQRYVVNELEAGYVKKIFDAAASREGFTAIIKELADAGITGKRGKPIKYTQGTSDLIDSIQGVKNEIK